MPRASLLLTASLGVLVDFRNPGYSNSVLRVDLENRGASAVTSWRVLGSAAPGAPLRDITPASVTAADGFMVVSPSPRAPGTLAAGQNTQLAINCTLWDRIQIEFAGSGAEVAAIWEALP